MNEDADLIARLRALGSEPVPPGVADRHLAAIEEATRPAAAGIRAHRLRIVAAFAVGLLAGTSGLATAGALPNGAQEVAHRTLGAVGIKVPHGNRYWGQECAGEVQKNHGQYVRSLPKEKRVEAAASRCGKPIQAGTGDDGNDNAGAQCQGPPPWAGKGKPDAAAKAAWKAKCGKDDDADDEKAPASGVQPAAPAPETSTPTVPSTQSPQTSDSTATTATTATTVTTAPASTSTTSAPEATTSTTDGTGPGGTTTPSTPVEPPAVGQAS